MTIFRLLCLIVVATSCIAAADWNESGGPNGDGVVRGEIPLIADASRARLVWQSERLIAPGRVADARRASAESSPDNPHSGGFASPIVADGRVYMVTYRPTGKVYDKSALERAAKLLRPVHKFLHQTAP